ncbi:MAG: Uma2 family endonuclease, partial [Pirellulales bacterium]
PIDVHLAEFDVVVPDFVVLLPANRIVTPTKIKGVPDLLIEILSPSTREYDRTLKRKRYEAAGVPEFWLVDPENHTVEQLILRDGKYTVRDHDEVVQLAILDQVTVDFSKVW